MSLRNIYHAEILAHGDIQPNRLGIVILEIIQSQTSRGADLVPDPQPCETYPRPNDIVVTSLQIWDGTNSAIGLWLVIEGRG